MAALLQIWSAPKCQAGAQPVAPLPATVSAQIVEALGGNESGAIVVDAATARDAGLTEGRIVRAVLPLRGTMEWVITQVSDQDPAGTVTATLGPLRHLLALRGFVREVTATNTVLTFEPPPLSVGDLITRYVLTNLADDGLSWLSLGTVEFPGSVTVGSFTQIRRGELLSLIERVTGYEVQLRRLTGDTGYAIDVLQQRGDTLPVVLLETPATALDISRTRDLAQTATVVMPIGDDGLVMGEVEWTGGTPIGTGPFWIPLSDPTGGDAPIREDDQFVGAFLALPSGSTLPILDSRASDSAVQVASLGSYASGQSVVLWEATTGRPVSTLSSPSALAATRGRVLARVVVKGARQERTLNRNGTFAAGGTYWTHGTFGEPITRTDFNKTLTFLVNGARAAGTGTGTPLAVDGLPANERLYEGDQLVIDGQTYTFTADAVPNTSGGLTASITPALAATYADNTAVSIVRRQRRTLVKDGTVSYATWLTNGLLTMKDQQTDGLLFRRLELGDTGNSIFRPFADCTLVHNASGADFTGNILSWDYTNGLAGAGTFDTSGFSGSPPAQFADNDTFTFTLPSEIRTLNFNGTQTSGATSVTFKNVTAIARRDWTTADTVFISRSLSATATITTLTHNGGRSFTATINTTSSTIDDIAAADRDGKAQLSLGGSWVVYYTGGGSFATTQLECTVVSVSGSTMELLVTDVTVNDVTGTYSGPTSGAWSVVDSYAVGASASWGNNGRVTISITIPAGRTISRGQPIYSNWVGGGSSGAEAQSATPLFAHATVVGSASSLEIAGWDDYRASWNGTSTETTGVWRLFSGTGASQFAFAGETMVCGVSTQANGSGQANVTLKAANTTNIANDATIRVVRPAMIPAGEPTTGSAMRLFFADSVPPANTGVQSEGVWVTVPAGTTRTLTATARVVLTSGEWAFGGIAPKVTIVNTSTGQTAGSASINGETTGSYTGTGISVVTARVTATISASGLYQLRLHGGSSTDLHRWCVVLDAQFYVGQEPLPFVAGSRSRLAFQRGQDILAQRKSSARYQVRGLDQTALEAVGTPIQLGQRARLRSAALDLDTTQRIVRLVWRWPGAELVELELEALTPRFTDVTVG